MLFFSSSRLIRFLSPRMPSDAFLAALGVAAQFAKPSANSSSSPLSLNSPMAPSASSIAALSVSQNASIASSMLISPVG